MLYKPDHLFFQQYQRGLLWFANTQVGRRVLQIPKTNRVICKITPNSTAVYNGDGYFTETIRSRNVYSTRILTLINWLPVVYFHRDIQKNMSWYPKVAFGLTTDTFNPDADPESTSVDGRVSRNGVNEAFSTIRAGAGNSNNSSGAANTMGGIGASTTTNQYEFIDRGIMLFDTSALNDGAIISAASIQMYATGKDNGLGNLSLVVVESTPASNTTLANSDYGNVGTTQMSDLIAINSLTLSAYNTWTLNASGIAAISLTGVSKFGMRVDNDRTGSAPTWSSGGISGCAFQNADGANDPILSVTYTLGGLPTSRAKIGVGK